MIIGSSDRGARRARRWRGVAFAAACVVASCCAARADPAPPGAAMTEEGVKAQARRWFTLMQRGEIDRAQYAPGYADQITAAAVKAMAIHLNQYGASTTAVEIVQTRKDGAQSFYEVNFLFPRGDATTLLFGTIAKKLVLLFPRAATVALLLRR